MKHYTLEQWDLYTGEKLPDEERTAYETHLGACDSCLELYMQSLERAAQMYPSIGDEAGLADLVMERINSEGAKASSASETPVPANPKRMKKTPVFTRHPLFHYTVAAAITIILMSSGVFQSLTETIGHFESAKEAVEQEREPEKTELTEKTEQMEQTTAYSSVSYRIMEKTIVMLDSIQPKHERGEDR